MHTLFVKIAVNMTITFITISEIIFSIKCVIDHRTTYSANH